MASTGHVTTSVGSSSHPARLVAVPDSVDVEAAVVHSDFADFYTEKIGPLVGALTATLADPVVAQDAAQEAMLRACQRWNKVAKLANPTGWCYRVGLNWATSRWRKRRLEVMTGTSDLTRVVNDPNPPDEELLKAVLSLSIDHRSVVVLRLWMDWSISETAFALDLPEGTVRSRLSRALDQLRRKLSPVDIQPHAPERGGRTKGSSDLA